LRWVAVVGGVVALLAGVHRILLLGEYVIGLAWLAAGIAALVWGARAPAVRSHLDINDAKL